MLPYFVNTSPQNFLIGYKIDPYPGETLLQPLAAIAVTRENERKYTALLCRIN